jgi:hypothetical protein
MNEEILMWMNRNYSTGFFCADLTDVGAPQISYEALSMLDLPILLHLKFPQLQEFVTKLIEQGISPNTSCLILQKNISSTLANILLKSRPLGLHDLFLVIRE